MGSWQGGPKSRVQGGFRWPATYNNGFLQKVASALGVEGGEGGLQGRDLGEKEGPFKLREQAKIWRPGVPGGGRKAGESRTQSL